MSDESFTNSFAMVAKVIDRYEIVINKGSNQGVKIGSKYLIYGIGNEIFDPESGDSLGKLELVRGIGVVTHVQDKMATIESAKTQRKPSTIRKVSSKPNQFNTLASLLSGTTDTVEEISGEAITVPFDDVNAGDFVRPL